MPPTTWEFALLECPRDVAASSFMKWLERLDQQPSARQVSGSFQTHLNSLLPLTAGDLRRFLFLSTSQSWTAYFDNGVRGSDTSSLSYLALTIGCRVIRIVDTPEGSGSLGASVLEIYGPHDTDYLNYIRSIAAYNEGKKWRFETQGPPLPFEDLESYRRRRIRDRFTPDMLRQYVSALHAAPFATANYGDGVLIERGDPEPHGIEKFTFAEATRRFA